MRIIILTLLSILLALGIWSANQHHPFGSKLPALGPLLSPHTGFWKQAESVAQPETIVLELEELSEEVVIVLDERLVPHIFAANPVDAAYAQGYIVASHRLWQMDISVRATIGRLAEVLGDNLIERDRLQRRKGLLWAAERAMNSWKKYPEEWAMLEAYTKGANAYINSLSPADYPIEFKLLGYSPEPWTELNSAVFFKSMAETLSSRNRDLAASNTLAWLGEESFDFLFPEWNPRQSPIIPESVEWNFEPAVQPSADTLVPDGQIGQMHPYRTFPLPPEFIGSNNWAVGGSKTASGHPMLCNDPHLNLTLPAIWYEVQIHTPEYNAYGVALPGVPGIVIGFNEAIAWGVTNVGQDVMDWYTIDWVDEQKESYRMDGQEMPVEKLVEVIRVRGQSEPLLDTVKYTYWGPVVYEDNESEFKDMAMRWIAHDVPSDTPYGVIGAFNQLARATSYEDYYAALQGYENPGQNFVFASKTGDIAITVNGKFPIKEKEQGRFIQAGNTRANEWKGYIPYEQLPRVKNPERGFVSSANQHSTTPDYPYYYNGGFDDFRGRYINRQLDSMKQVTLEDMKNLQLETYSIKAEEALPALLDLIDSTDQSLLSRPAVQELMAWNYRFDANQKAPALFQRWLDHAYEASFDEFLTKEAEHEVLRPETWRFIDLLENHPDHLIFDLQQTEERETAGDIAVQALNKALEEPAQIWSDYQKGIINHIGRIPAFSAPLDGVGGYADAPNAFKGSNGPSWRMIVELGEEVKGYGVYPGGQSGNPGSPFYQNMVQSWAEGTYHDLQFFKNLASARQAGMTIINIKK
jgi:penicillin amidase